MSSLEDHNDAINSKINTSEVFEDGDRLSSLPESLLITILSLLPIESAVATSVLSPHWRHLWTHITHLSLTGDCRDDNQFLTRVNQILSQLNSSKIHTFDLDISNPPINSEDILIPWISWICSLNPEVITVRFAGYKHPSIFQLPTCLLQTRSLVFLKVIANFQFKFSYDNIFLINLPNLKKLHLVLPTLNLPLIGTLFKSCPLLEYLILCFTRTDGDHTVDISAPNLKCLDMRLMTLDNWKVVINTPKLEKFCSSGNLVSYHFAQSPSTLQYARICFLKSSHQNDHLSKIQALFRGISYVRSLHLANECDYLLRCLNGKAVPIFRNLVHLRLGGRDWDQIPHVPGCLLAMPKTIELSCLFRTDLEGELVKYILSNATALEELHVSINKIYLTEYCEKDQLNIEYNFCKELFMLPRISSSCQIKVYGLRITASSNDMKNGVLTCQIVD